MSGGAVELDATAKLVEAGSKAQVTGITFYMFNRIHPDCKKTEPRRLYCRPSDESVRITTEDYKNPIEVVRKVINYYTKVFDGSVFSKELIEKNGAKLEGVAGTGTDDATYKDLTIKNKDTYKRLKQLSEGAEASKLEEGTSIAVYRAYVLASGISTYEGKKELLTYVCHDKWSTKGTPLSKLPLFAMLDQLYYDRLGNEMETETKEKYQAFIAKLIALGTIEQIDSEKTEQTISNLKFKDLTKENPLCKNKSSGFEKVTDPNVIGSVISEYTNISNELLKLIDSMTKVVDKIIDLKLFATENRVKLRPVFITEKRGAIYALNQITAEMRTLLENHILAVEDSYARGVASILNSKLTSLLVDFAKDEDPDKLLVG